MKEALVSKGPSVEIIDNPIPTPGPDQVLIRVIVSGTNPKDWKVPEWTDRTDNQGDDIAGIVAAVGDNVTEFKPGDRVAAFHQMMELHGSYAEYAISWQHTTFHIPKSTSFEAMTSAIALYHHLGLPEPWRPATSSSSIPLVIYGGATAVGAFAIQMAVKSNIHPIITVAGRGIPFVESLIDRSKGDTIVDYRKGDEFVVSEIKNALKAFGSDETLLHAFDGVSEGSSITNLGKVVSQGGKIAFVLPVEDDALPAGINKAKTNVGCVHADQKDFGFVHFRYIAKGLLDGWFKPHPHEVVPGGLGGLQQALTDLKNGKASAVKYVVRVGETQGVIAS
ncbi:hypothetical protein CNMCM8980_000509 [Aspergillus fumigatiaffinis]|nr:hypothetical protein CNMCM8980_000509 [Aspergillus fumigatiaffinis]